MLPVNSQARNLELGQLAPDVAMVERMVRDRIKFAGTPLLLFEDYRSAVANLSRHERDVRDGEASQAIAIFVGASRRERLTPDFEGWLRYLGKGEITKAMEYPRYQRTGSFPESGLEESVLVVAPRKWGKSELLKALIYHHVKPPCDTHPAAAVVVLDPGGDLAMQVARWPELSGSGRRSDRLVYVEPELRDGLTVGFNPLDGTGLDHRSRNHVAGMLVEAFSALIADLSLAMRNLIRSCCTVLLATPGATLRDLQRMLRNPDDEPRVWPLHERGCTYPDSEDIRDFFEQRFFSDAYKGTKEYLLNRLDEVMLTHDLAGLFGGAATVNLGEAIEAQKVVLVNLAKLENEEDQRFAGRLLATMVIAVARRRAQTPNAPRRPIHLVIDEATVLAGNELVRGLAQLRKWGLNLILAQQVLGSGFSPADRETLVNNTGCKFIGGRDRRVVADMLTNGRDFAENLPAIERTQFWSEWAGDGPNLLNVRSDLTKDAHTVSEAEWLRYVAQATASQGGYYRPTITERQPAVVRENHSPAEQTSDATAPQRATPIAPDPMPAAEAGVVVPPTPTPRRRSPAKPVDLVAKEGVALKKPRTKKAAKPTVPPEKPPEIEGSRRKLD